MCRDISQNATSFIILLDKVPGYNLNCQLIFHISSPVPTRNSHQSDYLPICRTPKMWTKVISNQGIFNIFSTFPPPFLDWFKVARSTLERFNSLQTVLVWRQLFKLHKQLPQKLHCLLDVLTFFFSTWFSRSDISDTLTESSVVVITLTATVHTSRPRRNVHFNWSVVFFWPK